MSTTTNREAAPRDGRSVDHRLARLLDSPFLARVVPHLAPETLHQLIQYRGLDACGQLVTAATPAQLTSLLDLDLWRHAQPGRDEQFDVDRFGEWVEVLVDTGDSVAARTVAALDTQLVIVGLSRYLRVFDPGTFEPTESSDDEAMERHDRMNSETSGDVLECEMGGYLVRARRTDAWDAIVTLLVTLETEQNDHFHAVMHGCRRLSNSRPEIDGLDDLLMAPEQHLHDVAIERERRRSRHGYASPADARAFLQMARQPRAASAPTAPIAINPIATAYFRATEEEEGEADTTSTSVDASERVAHHAAPAVAKGSATQVGGDDDAPTSIDAVIQLLAEAGLMPDRPRALLEAPDEDPRAASIPLLRRLMRFVLHHDETAYLSRNRELAFLANTLVAGASVQSRPFTPQEASDAAACICNLGLECWPARWPGTTSLGASSPRGLETAMPPDAFLVDRNLVTAFEVGWSVLYQDVSLFVADQLVSTLADLHRVDADTGRGLDALTRMLVKQREAGTPWRARDAADVLALLDMTAWISVLGLLDECPILPAALRAVLERRTSPVSPRAFEFISTNAQIGDIRVFMRTLSGVLSG
ncbi:hypothetical protein LuPra_01506 [Luteitalea pratensis]|uniref:Uncharacterized protein n=1 Tax=Luteitalea pratensis TaxID=1855912 RepID=A0A143PIB5_LUTPR|nr:DUF6178 family protein [Luteitalea pratensis]AMY08312.1 hypothetical protein LuPra_01506 [Luteitalea pratensis]